MSKTAQNYLSTNAFFSESGEDLLKSGLFSDVTVKCGNRTWNLHKAIICTRCPYFKKAFNGNFKEAATGELTFQDQKPEELDQAIYFLYTGKLPKEVGESIPMGLLEIADYLQIQLLMIKVLEVMKKKLDKTTDELQPKLSLVRYTYEDNLVAGTSAASDADIRKSFASGDMDCFLLAAKAAYGIADSRVGASLRMSVKEFAVKTRRYVLANDRFTEVLRDYPDLAIDVLKSIW